jgi:D-glycero-D-manno-heptose 1,7-bisphosphate phosphatase
MSKSIRRRAARACDRSETTVKLVILDRDGVVNADSPNYIRSPKDLYPIPGSLEAIARFTQAGILVALATNQSGLSRGYFDMDALNAIHQRLVSRVAAVGGRIDLIAFCPHGPDDDCACRKPASGLLASISRRLACPLGGVPFIGDSLRDMEAGRAAGADPVLVLTGNGEKTRGRLAGDLARIPVYADLWHAAEGILADAHA